MTANMDRRITEWLTKAEGDFRVACREATVEDEPHYDSVCFHIQQCIEKYLKALIVYHNMEPPRTHDLFMLIRLLIPVLPELKSWLNEPIAEINVGAVEIRYPGTSVCREDMLMQLETCYQFRSVLRSYLGLKTP
jgi:HEPN domain-containing protein